MTGEILAPLDRKPAIDPARLRFPNGMPANKYSMLLHAQEAGLPVPKIIHDEQFQENEANRPYRRGYFINPVDMWSVNTLPTGRVRIIQDKEIVINHLREVVQSNKLSNYLRVNFDLEYPEARSFLQEAIPVGVTGFQYYYSTWARQNKVYGSAHELLIGGPVSYVIDENGDITGNAATASERSLIRDKIHPLGKKVKLIFDKLLNGSYDYKIDYLRNGREIHVIQIRIASEETNTQSQNESIKKMKKSIQDGAHIFSVEVGDLEILPKVPYILALYNEDHNGELDLRKQMQLDMRNMKGLLLPCDLSGGLLQHNAYVLIAYALYWGLPIVINNEMGDLIE